MACKPEAHSFVDGKKHLSVRIDLLQLLQSNGIGNMLLDNGEMLVFPQRGGDTSA